MEQQYEIKDVVISWYDDPENEQEVYVVIGDGKTEFDENFEFDSRIFFYFQDQAEFDLAKGNEIQENIGFRILKELD
jgi:hypothetical protein